MKLKSIDIASTASAATIVFEALRKAIIEGELAAGEPLRQDEIARLFNVSRIPVREAISRLEEHGLVRAQRYKGAVVAGLSVDEVREIQDLRALIEPEIIRRAVPRMTAEHLSRARTACEAFAAATDPMSWGDLNRAFHAALYDASGLPYHLEVTNNAMDRVDRYIRMQLLLSQGNDRANAEHMAILAACESGAADRAAELTRQHVIGVRDSLLAHIDKG
jgi:DNA-binding GntR family transcriptional regulator